MAWDFENAMGSDAGDGGGSWSWGGSDEGGDDIARTYGFARNVNTFLNAGETTDGAGGASGESDGGGGPADGSAPASGQSPAGTTAGGAGMPGASAPGVGDSGGLSPLQRLQQDQAKNLNGFLDAGKNWRSGAAGYGNNAWEIGGRNGSFGLGENSNEFTTKTVGGGDGLGGGTTSESSSPTGNIQAQPNDRDTWEKIKGIDYNSKELAKGPAMTGDGKINSPYGPRQRGSKTFHYGVDISNPLGGNVVATDSGEVVNISPTSTGETRVEIVHIDGSKSTYLHVAPSVKKGQRVSAGDVIGSTDMSGDSSGPHIHYGYRRSENGPYVDPMEHLPRRR